MVSPTSGKSIAILMTWPENVSFKSCHNLPMTLRCRVMSPKGYSAVGKKARAYATVK
jgi:hypothetical protein